MGRHSPFSHRWIAARSIPERRPSSCTVMSASRRARTNSSRSNPRSALIEAGLPLRSPRVVMLRRSWHCAPVASKLSRGSGSRIMRHTGVRMANKEQQ